MKMSNAAKIGKKAIWLANGAVNALLLVVILLLLAFATYAMWDTGQVHHAANAARYGKYKPVAEDDGASFEELRAINPEVIAWLTVYGTHIDYPVTQSLDNSLKYVNTDAFGNYSLSGAIFLDSKNSPDFSDFNNILYGHHMEKQTMFGEIGLFSDKSYFDARKYGMLFYDGREHGIEFFAFAHTNAYNSIVFHANIMDRDDQQAYLDMLLGMSTHTRESVLVTTDDNIAMLSTCSETSTNGRDILIGRISDEVFSDPFIGKGASSPVAAPSTDHLPGMFAQMPTWAKLAILAALLLLIIAIVIIVRALRKRKRRYAP